jgi:DNA-directed RNA polymerase specialized sigma24 family protein
VLYGVIHRILPNRSDADDIQQEVFIRVWTPHSARHAPSGVTNRFRELGVLF